MVLVQEQEYIQMAAGLKHPNQVRDFTTKQLKAPVSFSCQILQPIRWGNILEENPKMCHLYIVVGW